MTEPSAPYRVMKPWEVWLLLIPFFNVFWNFRVFPGLSHSFKAYFEAKGDSAVGDRSAKVARWLSLSGVSVSFPRCGLADTPTYIIGGLFVEVTELEKRSKPLNKISHYRDTKAWEKRV